VARIYSAPASYGPLVVGGLAGGTAAALATAVLVALHAVSGTALAPLNAIGGLAVRWLQTADRSALELFYVDATLIGVATCLAAGAALGAAFGAALDRLPKDQPIAWGVVAALAIFAATWWRILPTLDPLVPRVIRAEHWLVSLLVYGLCLGWWVHVDRHA
jgi:hypothetical protein